MKGKFITFEGIDGAGKSTQIQMLSERLQKLGYETVVTREPGGTEVAERVREIVLDGRLPLSARSEALLFMASRSEHVEKIIRPALLAGKAVLCDRFCDSTFVYQGLHCDVEMLRKLNYIATDGLMPDVTIVLDGDPEMLLQRRTVRGVQDRFENKGLEFQKRLRQGFLDLAKEEPERIRVVDGMASREDVAAAIASCLKIS